MDGHSKVVLSKNNIWYDLGKFRPDLAQHDLLSLISNTDIIYLLGEASIPESAKIPTPERFELPYTPRQIICIGRNYAAHAEELGNEIPTSPILFNKLPSSCIGDNQTVEILQDYGRVDYEGEIAVVIGKNTHNCPKSHAFDAILGYTLLNDFTAREIQQKAKEKGHPWLLAKSLRTFCPIGPYITSKNELPWPLEIDIQLTVNGETRQNGNTKQFLFDVPTLISYISSVITLYPGDIIATGTPEGVSPVQNEDHVELSATGLGSLKNPISCPKTP